MESGPVSPGFELTPIWHPSPNFGPRRNGILPQLVVLHFTAMKNAQAALERLCDPKAEVSAHYLIGSDGTCWQMVDEAQRAWHAGAGEWAGAQDVNSRSIGIELDNRGTHPFAEPQMQVLEDLLDQIMTRWTIPRAGVIGHSDMAPGRKIDPGPRFDWQRLARRKLAIWAQGEPPAEADWNTFCDLTHRIGYTAQMDNALRLCTFRLRFRPWASGPLSAEDVGCARAIGALA